MKINHVYLVILLSLLLCKSNILAQDNLFTITKPQFVSPEVSSLMRFDDTPVSMNAGKTGLVIPLINFSDPDFDLPLSINYNSGGFKPSEVESSVGLNWSLSLGGVIYRETKGIPDDHSNRLFEDAGGNVRQVVNGFLSIRDNPRGKAFKESIFNDPDKYAPIGAAAKSTINGTNIEASSDIYRFNFGKYFGTFMIEYDGTARAICHSGGSVNVDITSYYIASDMSINKSEIRIKTDDGYIYHFGGSYSAMEYTALSWTDFASAIPANYNQSNPNEITAFHLSKITAPNGRTLTIAFDGTVDLESQYHHSPQRLIMGSIKNVSSLSKCYQLKGSPFYMQGQPAIFKDNESKSSIPLNTIKKSYTLNKIALIKAISTDNQTVKLHYSPRAKTVFENDNKEYSSQLGAMCGVQLDSITHFNSQSSHNGDKLETILFNYEYSTGTYPRLFLKSLSKSTSGKYQFIGIGV